MILHTNVVFYCTRIVLSFFLGERQQRRYVCEVSNHLLPTHTKRTDIQNPPKTQLWHIASLVIIAFIAGVNTAAGTDTGGLGGRGAPDIVVGNAVATAAVVTARAGPTGRGFDVGRGQADHGVVVLRGDVLVHKDAKRRRGGANGGQDDNFDHLGHGERAICRTQGSMLSLTTSHSFLAAVVAAVPSLTNTERLSIFALRPTRSTIQTRRYALQM